MNKGKLYGVGVGPGDKELLTLKAVRIFEECDVIAVPVTGSGDKTAYNIAEDFIKNKKILECNMSMTKDKNKLDEMYQKVAESIKILLDLGKNVAFITLGDPTVYSTYMQVNDIIKKWGYSVEIISGITSFCAAAAKLNISLCERAEPLVILPASYKQLKEGLDFKGNTVLMKSASAITDVIQILKDENRLDKAKMVECCGMENEKVYNDLSEVTDDASYFSIIIVKE